MRLTKLFVGSVVGGGVLAAAALLTAPDTHFREPRPAVTPARLLDPTRPSRPDCPPPQIAPSCPPGATHKYILWKTR